MAPAAKRGKIWLWLSLVLVVFCASRVWLLLRVQPESSDLGLYAGYAVGGMDFKKAPYRDYPVEYPPLAWWLIASPRLFDSKIYPDVPPKPEVVQEYCEWMELQYHREFLLIDVASLLLIWAIGRRLSPWAECLLPTLYTLSTIAQPHLLYDRLDLGLTLLLLLWIYCWLRSLDDSPRAILWTCASYLFLGLGCSFKIAPLVCIPFLLLADLWASRSVWRPLALSAALAIGALGPFLVQYRTSGWWILTPFRFHAEREIHLESLWGSIMLVARSFGVPGDVIKSHGGYNLTGTWYKSVKLLSTCSVLASGALWGLWALLRWRHFDRRAALDLAMLVLINSMVLSHVFSPQFLNWTLPVAYVLAWELFDRRWGWWALLVALCVAILWISAWIFPSHYPGLRRLFPFATNLSIARSTCLAMLALLLNAGFLAKFGVLPWRHEADHGT